MAVGGIDVIAAIDAFGVFGVLAAAVANAPLTIADTTDAAADCGTVAMAVVGTVIGNFDFFLIVLPDYRRLNHRFTKSND